MLVDFNVAKVLREGVVLPAHGPAEMPIWGRTLRWIEGEVQTGNLPP